MPNPTPVLQLIINGGSPVRGGQTCAYGDTIRVSLASTNGIQNVRYWIESFPPGWACPAGWSTDTDSGRYFVDIPAGAHATDFALPASVTWGKWWFSCWVNGDQTARDDWAGVQIIPGSGIEDIAVREGGQFAAAGSESKSRFRSWVASLRRTLRALDGAILSGGGSANTWSVGDKALWYGQADLATAAACGDFAGDVTTGFNFRVMRAATCSGVRAFVHWGGGGTKNVKCSLWDCSGATSLIATKTLNALSSNSLHDFIFPATHALTTDRAYMVTAYITDGSYETRWVEAFAVPPTAPFFAGPNVLVIDAGMNVAGDALPDSPGSPVPLQPLFV